MIEATRYHSRDVIMAVSNTGSKNTSIGKRCVEKISSRNLLKFCAFVGAICVFVLGVIYKNSVDLSDNQKSGEIKSRRSLPDFKSQLLNSFKAENLEENLR